MHADDIGFGRRQAVMYGYQPPVAAHVPAINLSYAGRRRAEIAIKQSYVGCVNEVGTAGLEQFTRRIRRLQEVLDH